MRRADASSILASHCNVGDARGLFPSSSSYSPFFAPCICWACSTLRPLHLPFLNLGCSYSVLHRSYHEDHLLKVFPMITQSKVCLLCSPTQIYFFFLFYFFNIHVQLYKLLKYFFSGLPLPLWKKALQAQEPVCSSYLSLRSWGWWEDNRHTSEYGGKN